MPCGILPPFHHETDSFHFLQQGIKCVVFEQDAALDSRPRDWNFAIYWAQVPLEECLPDELNSLIETCQVDSHKPSEEDVFPLYNGQSGELMKQLPAPYNIRLQRRKLLRLISKGIDIRASIVFGRFGGSVK